MFIMIYKYNRN